MTCKHEWVVHFITRAREEKPPQRDTEPLITDVSICRWCGAVDYFDIGKKK